MAIAGSRLAARVTHRFRRHVAEATDAMGGRTRARSIVLLASVLALDAADKGAVGAVAVQLEHGLHVGNTDLGLMVTVSSLVGAAATVPIGALTDRYHRSRLLWMSITLWAVAEAAGGFSPSFTVLIATRVALGAVTGTAGPTVASLTGDLFEPGERSRMYGFILTGEFVGTGIGVLVAVAAAGPFGWRASFITLSLPSLFLAWAVHRWLPEPERGATTRKAIAEPDPDAGADEERDLVMDLVKEREIPPEEANVVADTGDDMTLWEAVRYVLRVRTNVILIVASSLGYFFFSGLRTFAVIFIRGRFNTGQAGATAILLAVGAGAFAGLLIAGQSGDALLRRGHLSGRIVVGAVAYVAAATFLLPGLLSPWLLVSLPMFILAGAAVAAPNPALDAARLDVVPARLWGRAEGVRTLVRQLLEALAPLVFGLMSATLGSGRSPSTTVGLNNHATVSAAQTRGLQLTFVVMLGPLLASGVVLLWARRSYPTDVSSAVASDEVARERLEREHARPRRE